MFLTKAQNFSHVKWLYRKILYVFSKNNHTFVVKRRIKQPIRSHASLGNEKH